MFASYMKKFFKKGKGVTLIELIVAILIVSVVIITFIGTFGNISKSLFYSKARMLATNLAQEKVNILRSYIYYRLLITTAPAYLSDFSPPVPYDPGYYPPEDVLQGGINFKRYTYVQIANEVNGEIQTFDPTSGDTGMKLVTVTVVWQQGGEKKKVQLRTIVSNPEFVQYNAQVKGNVKKQGTATNIENATVLIAENATWTDKTDSQGNYSINLLNGNYGLVCSAWGYFTKSVQISVGPNQTVTQDFELTPMSSGTVYGYVWYNDHLVISQVVASVEYDGFKQEYVELFNPTTYTWQIAIDSVTPIIGLKYHPADPPIQTVNLIYYTTEIPPYSYYLIANTTTVNVLGVSKDADAVFVSTNVIKCKEDDDEAAGGVGIYYVSDDSWIDVVGWDWNSGDKSAPIYETDGIDQNIGFQRDEQYIRHSSTSGVITGIGRCYDSNNNEVDFIDYVPLIYPPKNSSDIEPIVAGVPANGAIITSNDGLSGGATAYLSGLPPVSVFNLVTVATGTWTVMATYNNRFIEISSVEVLSNGQIVGIPNSTTIPTWPFPGYHSLILDQEMTDGFISGKVTDVNGNPITPPITVMAGGYQTNTNVRGYYFLQIATGIYNVTANPGNKDPRYVSQTRSNIEVKQGQITSGVDFALSQGGKITGMVTRDGINPVPDVVMIAIDRNDLVRGESMSDVNGRFQIINLATGTYYVKPVLSSKESSTPERSTCTVTVGSTIFAGTFTVRGVLGKIKGRVTDSGVPIRTGVLLIATTSTITGTPPALGAQTLTGAPYFVNSSWEDGTYYLEVIGSTVTPYNVYAYYVVFSTSQPDTPVIKTQSRSNIYVNQSEEVTGVNFSW
ncbi:MAG: carboxypeptidase regulatory-like domain-containing protein [Endomicrobiia bacterium]